MILLICLLYRLNIHGPFSRALLVNTEFLPSSVQHPRQLEWNLHTFLTWLSSGKGWAKTFGPRFLAGSTANWLLEQVTSSPTWFSSASHSWSALLVYPRLEETTGIHWGFHAQLSLQPGELRLSGETTQRLKLFLNLTTTHENSQQVNILPPLGWKRRIQPVLPSHLTEIRVICPSALAY